MSLSRQEMEIKLIRFAKNIGKAALHLNWKLEKKKTSSIMKNDMLYKSITDSVI